MTAGEMRGVSPWQNSPPSEPFDPPSPSGSGGAWVVLREMTEWGTGRAESSMKSTQQHWRQRGQRASISSADSRHRLIHQPPRGAVVSLNSPGTPGIPRLLPLCPSSLYCHSISPSHSGSPSLFTLFSKTKSFSSTSINSDQKKKKKLKGWEPRNELDGLCRII